MALSEQEILRRQSLQELMKLGIDPYPAEEFPVNISAENILKRYIENPENEELRNVSIAGRLMSKRIMGSASFAELQDGTGKIQLYLNRDEVSPGEDKSLYNTIFKKLMDLGDIVGVTGYVFTTKTGEISIHVKTLRLLSK